MVSGRDFMSVYSGAAELLVSLKRPSASPDDATVTFVDDKFDGVPVRIYSPVQRIDNGSAIIFFHGGGWTIGSIAMYHFLLQTLAEETNVVIVSVGYRLAPVHVYPAAFDDCTAVTIHFLEQASSYGVDPGRIAVMGDSAGGNLAAAVSLKLRNQSMQPKNQILIYPALQAIDIQTPSYQQNGNSKLLLSTDVMTLFWLYYATGNMDHFDSMKKNEHTVVDVKKRYQASYLDHSSLPKGFISKSYTTPTTTSDSTSTENIWSSIGTTFTDQYFAPLMASDVSELPSAYIYTGHYDVLRDDGVWYADRLKEAGVAVEHFHHMASFHGILGNFDTLPEGKECYDRVVKYIKENL